MLLLKQASVILLGALGLAKAATTQVHDASFVPDAVLRITAANLAQSCLPPKWMVLVNGTAPGPELRLQERKTYWIRVYNDMTDNNLTMHWHGLTQGAAPFSDGSPSASQWPLPPSHFFDYELSIPSGMAGSYYYHSHVGFQSVSASGPLIIEDPVQPFPYNDEKIIYLQDLFVKNDTTIEQGLAARYDWSWSGESAMVLVNGKGGGSANGTACNASLSIIDVEPGKTYRLRFIGATALTFASLAIEDHLLTIIQADGSYTQPHETSFLQITTGQRFDVLLHTHSAPLKSQYTIQIESRERPTVTRGFAILNYGVKPVNPVYPPADPPLTLPPTSTSFLEYELRPFRQSDIDNFPTAAEVTRRVIMTVHQHALPGQGGQLIWLENNFSWTEDVPKEPYLVSLYKDDGVEFPSMERALKNNGLDLVSGAFPAEIGEVLEIVIQNTGADSGGLDTHPWHAHGSHYYDIGSGSGTYNAAMNEVRLIGMQPVKRDTTVLYRYATSTTNGTDAGWRAWRLRVTEPGVWMIHCHILQHMLMGMQTVWVMGNETELLDKVPRPEVEGYLTYGGNVYGNATHWPEVVQYSDEWAEEQ